jgi:hypothetical protein
VPELTIHVEDRRNIDNLIRNLQFFYGPARLPHAAGSSLDPSVTQISSVTKQLLAKLRNEYNIMPEPAGGESIMGTIANMFSLAKAHTTASEDTLRCEIIPS